MLRALRIDKTDLKTLLDIPLAILSAQNVISLVELRKVLKLIIILFVYSQLSLLDSAKITIKVVCSRNMA